jgi:putative transposase
VVYQHLCEGQSAAGLRRSETTKPVSMDPGLKDFAVRSGGYVVDSGRHYRKREAQLSTGQRVRKKSRVRALHAKIKN